jgi:hypothetical protein
MHRHGSYGRYQQPKGGEKFPMQRYLCLPCGHTVSVLPANRLPYRPLEVERLQGGFDAQAEVGTGLDPPPEPIEAGCLQRAWNRFLTRVQVLQDTFGQILPAELHTAQQLWKELRRGVGSAESMLRFLARHRAVWFVVGGPQRPEGHDPTKGFSSPARLGALNQSA